MFFVALEWTSFQQIQIKRKLTLIQNLKKSKF